MAGRIKDEFVYCMLDTDFDAVVLSADSIQELADKAGVKRATIDSTMSRAKKRGTRCKYIRICIKDDEEE